MKKLLNTLFINGGGYFLSDQSRKEERTGVTCALPRSSKGGQRRSDNQTRLSGCGGGLRG